MKFDIQVGDYRLGMVEKVEVRRSVEELADTAIITLPGAEYNAALQVEDKLHRGDRVVINLGYDEVGMVQEFEGWVQRVGTDGGAITLECEDDLFLFRKAIPDAQIQNVTLAQLLARVIEGIGGGFKVDSSYSWTYKNFVISSATASAINITEKCFLLIIMVSSSCLLHRRLYLLRMRSTSDQNAF